MYTDKDYNRFQKEPNTIPAEGEEGYGTEFRRDYSRLIHCPSFRRLQGKTQLFPGLESDFFRNRLTHSLEVAQVAKSIAIRLNYLYDSSGNEDPGNHSALGIDLDLVELAGLAHDLGHPPFGHQGEEALDLCMKDHGGFEGNAQTLRILSRLEKKVLPYENTVTDDSLRSGLNLTFRTLASVLKYDYEIPLKHTERKKFKETGEIYPVKGYYETERDLVQKIKEAVLEGKTLKNSFKTIECQIMDIADDIAYSTYDLEDSLKAGFVTPFDILYAREEVIEIVTAKVNKTLRLVHPITVSRTREELYEIFKGLFRLDLESRKKFGHLDPTDQEAFIGLIRETTQFAYESSNRLAADGFWRTQLTSALVASSIKAVSLETFDTDNPALSKITMDQSMRIRIEILKQFTFQSMIMSPRLKIPEVRGKDLVTRIFNALSSNPQLLPNDVQVLLKSLPDHLHPRVVCDFVSGMTDRYAIEFYGRLTSERPETIFKPL